MMASSIIPQPALLTEDTAAPDFVVVDVETACSRVSSICQVGIVGFKDGVEMFEYETLVEELRHGGVPIEIVTEGEFRRQFKLCLA